MPHERQVRVMEGWSRGAGCDARLSSVPRDYPEVSMRTRMAALMAAVPLLLGGTAAVTAATGAAAMVSPAAASGPCGTLTSAPHYTHVIWVWMENHSYNTIIGSS